MSRENKILNNKGMTLIEILVTIAIMMILVAIAALSYTMVDNANVSKFANAYDNLLNKARTESMARGTEAGKLVLTMHDGILYGKVGDDGEERELSSKRVTVAFLTDAADYTSQDKSRLWGEGESHEILFNSSGMCLPSVDSVDIRKLIFFRGNRNVEVVLYRETGKHDVTLFYD